MVDLDEVAEGVWEQLNHPGTLPFYDEHNSFFLYLPWLTLMSAEGAPGHIDHPGTILNWFIWESFLITLFIMVRF